MPDWPGREGFAGELIHGQDYRNPEPYRDRDVLVVGSGNTGAEIAVDLVEGGASSVRIAIRTPPNVMLREVNGMPSQVTGVLMRHLPVKVADAIANASAKMVIGDLTPYGLPPAPRGPFTRAMKEDAIPILDVGLVDMLKKGRIEVVAAVESFDGRRRAAGRRLADPARRRDRLVRLRARARAAGGSPRPAGLQGPPGGARGRDAPGRARHVLHRLHEPRQRHVPRVRDRGPQDREGDRARAAQRTSGAARSGPSGAALAGSRTVLLRLPIGTQAGQLRDRAAGLPAQRWSRPRASSCGPGADSCGSHPRPSAPRARSPEELDAAIVRRRLPDHQAAVLQAVHDARDVRGVINSTPASSVIGIGPYAER